MTRALEPLIDAHAHFYHAESGRADWRRVNDARMRAGEFMGITYHVASILGSYGHSSPTYFPSPEDVTRANAVMGGLAAADPDRVRWYVTVNPNHTAHALHEIRTGVAIGAVGVKLLASRRADAVLNDPICELAEEHRLPVLHHIWQHRTREWPNQEISDGRDLAQLAARHPSVSFILAHLGGGGDWAHTLPAVVDTPNVHPDLSGSGVDRGMVDAAIEALGARRLLWACDLTMETGLSKLRALDVIGLASGDIRDIRFGNAMRLFRPGTFPRCEASP
ncbi:MAG: amidohydrolase family protein [Gemmatimonadaceae bacterium]